MRELITEMLHDMRNLSDSDTLSIVLVREMLQSILDEEGESCQTPQN